MEMDNGAVEKPEGGAWSDTVRTGLSGGMAMFAQSDDDVCDDESSTVVFLMWLRTTTNYQYHTGLPLTQAWKRLYADGGIRRFYKGIAFASVQAPLVRFGDTAANAGSNDQYDVLSAGRSTDRETLMQVRGSMGLSILKERLKDDGVLSLYRGSMAVASGKVLSHFPWFLTYNLLDRYMPSFEDERWKGVARNGLVGFACGAMSDLVSNPLRALKTLRQTSKESRTYRQMVNHIITHNGITSLLFRGLSSRLMTNGIQSIAFVVIWKEMAAKVESHSIVK